MKTIYSMITFGLVALLSGCATSSQVQKMIDASNQDYLTQLKAHEESIDVLKKSAMAGLEKSQENAKKLAELQKQLEGIAQQMKVAQGYADAAKVMSAANTVKVADLSDDFNSYKEATDKKLTGMTAIDKLYEQVLIKQYKEIADSANAAIESLKADGFSSTTNAPVKLDKPIEIVAPDTSVPTNHSESTNQSTSAK